MVRTLKDSFTRIRDIWKEVCRIYICGYKLQAVAV